MSQLSRALIESLKQTYKSFAGVQETIRRINLPAAHPV